LNSGITSKTKYGKTEISKRWLEKSKKYDRNNVEEVMDKFFSLYVAYNAMYSKFSQVPKSYVIRT